MRRILAIIGAAIGTGSACADTITWTGNGADNLWINPANWDTGVPGAGDRAVLDDDLEIAVIRNIDNITVETVEISNEGAGILIQADGTDNDSLTLTNHACQFGASCGLVSSIVDGVIELEAEATLAFTTRNHTISGLGGILSPVDNSGNAIDDGQITVASGITFRNGNSTNGHTAIRGALAISGDGAFLNDGLVEAIQDDPGDPGDTDFLFVSVAALDDTEDAIWTTNCQAQLKFTTTSDTCLEGDFDTNGPGQDGSSGEFSFDGVKVHTQGDLVMTNGCLNLFLSNGAEFAVGGVVDQGGCELNTTVVSSTCLGSGWGLGTVGTTTDCTAQ